MRTLLLYLVSILLFIQCDNKKNKINATVRYWQDRELKIPNTLQTKIFGKDTACKDLWNSEYKIIRYIDTSGCTSCKLNLYEWRLLIEEMEHLTPNVNCIFILSLKNYETFENLQKENRFKWPVAYDRSGALDSLNHLPTNPMFRTLLLDRNNKIIALGDPIENPKIWELYLNIIKNNNAPPKRADNT